MSQKKIRTALYNVLPGEKAHSQMAPRPKYIEGIEGKHTCPPVNSAVLVLVVPYGDNLAIPFIQRSNRGKYHGGQIAFPGGKMEKGDANALQTALRECHEEIGVPEEKVSILGVLSDIYIPLSNFNITFKPHFTYHLSVYLFFFGIICTASPTASSSASAIASL